MHLLPQAQETSSAQARVGEPIASACDTAVAASHLAKVRPKLMSYLCMLGTYLLPGWTWLKYNASIPAIYCHLRLHERSAN